MSALTRFLVRFAQRWRNGARPHSAATPVGTLPTGIEALERSLAAARAERVETLEPVERSAEAAARELLEERQVQNQHHCPRTVTHLRSAPSFLKPPVQLGRQVVAEQRQVERSKPGADTGAGVDADAEGDTEADVAADAGAEVGTGAGAL